MAAVVGAVSNELVVGGKPQRETRANNGLLTPEGTPEVEDGRVQAELQRQVANTTDITLPLDDDNDESSQNGSDHMSDAPTDDNIPWPTVFVQEIYREATKHFSALFADSTNLATLAELKALNDKIIQQNEKDEIPSDQWTINIPMVATTFDMSRPYYDRLLRRGVGEPADEEALRELNKINDILQEAVKKYHFPSDWGISPPSEQTIAMAQVAKKKADETLELRKREMQAGKEKERLEAERLKAEKLEAKRKEAERLEAERLEAKRLEAERLEAKRLWEESLAKTQKVPPAQYPWTTFVLPDGRVIIAGRQHTRRGKLNDKSTLVVASDQSEDPTFVVTTGGAVGALEAEEYFNLPGIKLLSETNSDGKKAKTWTWRDEKNFIDLLWIAVGDRKLSTFGKNSKAAEGQCCVKMTYGLDICTRSELGAAISKKSADSRIDKYCARKKIPAPWDVKPKAYIVAAELMQNLGLGSSSPADSAARIPKVGTSGVASFQTSNVSGSSLDSVLARLEARLASIEIRMAKVDKLETGLLTIAALLDNAGITAPEEDL